MRALVFLLVIALVCGTAWGAGLVYGRTQATARFRAALQGLSDRINDEAELADGVLAVELSAALKHIKSTDKELS